jgi:hypothetical protein
MERIKTLMMKLRVQIPFSALIYLKGISERYKANESEKQAT